MYLWQVTCYVQKRFDEFMPKPLTKKDIAEEYARWVLAGDSAQPVSPVFKELESRIVFAILQAHRKIKEEVDSVGTP